MKKKSKILITGGAGYIGSVLCTELVRRGYYVTVIDKLEYERNSLNHLFLNKNFKLINEDMFKVKKLKGLIASHEFIIPLAALVGAPLCDKKKKLAKKTNHLFIKNLINKMNKKNKIIYPTTNSGYGVGQKGKYCDENSPLNPISLYGVTKNLAEKEVAKHNNWVSFRLATVFGFSYRLRNDLMVNNFVYRCLKTKKITLYEPHFRRNFIHINDVVDAFIFVIENFSKVKNNTYNLGLSSANITKIQLAKKIKRQIKNLKIIINEFRKDPDQRDYFVSNAKIEKQGFRAKITLDEGIRELISIFNVSDKQSRNY